MKDKVKDKAREERRKIINKALAISTLDCKAPLPEDMILFEKFIDGEMEIDEVKKNLIEKYSEI